MVLGGWLLFMPAHAPLAVENAGGRFQSELIIYQDGAIPLVGNASPLWDWQGAAFSAMTDTFYAGRMAGAGISWARFVLVWTPGTSGGVRLVIFDDGVINLESVCVIEVQNYYSPRVDNCFGLEAVLQALLDNQTGKHFGIQTYGDGYNAPRIYLARIDIIWR